MKHLPLFGLVLALGACAILGPPTITLSRGEIAERAFVDRSAPEARKIFKVMEGLGISGPEVAFQLSAQRIELTWNARLGDEPLGLPLSLRVTLTGSPALSAQRDGIDLADARIEDVRLPSWPFSTSEHLRMQAGESLGTLALLRFRPAELVRDGVAYEATTVTLGAFGLRVDLIPK
jgi:hypothetical protein